VQLFLYPSNLCTEIEYVHWNRICVLKSNMCSQIEYVFSNRICVLKSNMCTQIKYVFSNRICVPKSSRLSTMDLIYTLFEYLIKICVPKLKITFIFPSRHHFPQINKHPSTPVWCVPVHKTVDLSTTTNDSSFCVPKSRIISSIWVHKTADLHDNDDDDEWFIILCCTQMEKIIFDLRTKK